MANPPENGHAAADAIDGRAGANGSAVANSLPRTCIVGAGSSGIAAAKALLDRGFPSTALRSQTRWAATGCLATATGCRPPTGTCSSTSRASGWPTRTIRCPAPIRTFLTTPTSRSTSTTTWTTSVCASTSPLRRGWSTRRSGGTACGRSRSSAQTGSARRASTTRWWSPMAITGTRAGPNRPFRAPTRSQEPNCMPTPTWTTRSSRARTWSCWAWATRRWTSRWSPRMWRPTPTLAARKGAWIIPKYVFGRPVDQLPNNPRVPFAIRQRMIHQTIKTITGPPERYGLPKPDHKFGEAHPTVSGRILDRIAHGTIAPKPNIASLEGEHGQLRRRQRGARRCRRVLHRLQDHFPVLRRGLPGCAREPHRAVQARLSSARSRACTSSACCSRWARSCRLAEAQSAWVGDYLRGEYALPSPAEVRRDIASDQAAMRKRYIASKRHTIQVDFDDYLYALEAERRAGAERARTRGFALPVRRMRPFLSRSARIRGSFLDRCSCPSLWALRRRTVGSSEPQTLLEPLCGIFATR